ncbi:cytokinin riboside 5'-monophosphate phosphoribohydrolase [Paenibacillus montaniterrae]|uniref:Cytokinin riboside 5'-monophosphate phosphoribohydrolase n=1 Tax=Paenibacillus montaniterrae TaxID=429341 RepID=A0A920CW99_9BACL|nr:TIGR00730 family Rossman fold protein [Paenibacillus montaniterrae]GIP14990.1 cytokinin riboside 5'-monophosphate phosphoribohydrolase [Paenibacillus montaniterrae]
MKAIAVYCGSSVGASPIYREMAIQLGKELVKRGLTLVYGGAKVGIMGIVADTVLEGGGEVIGVIPSLLEQREISHQGLTKLYKVETMHERKQLMIELADGFIALPGGPGTMEEFFEVFTWSQIGLHQKPCGLLNVNGYYDHLISFFEHMQQEQFLAEKYFKMKLVAAEPAELLDLFDKFVHPGLKEYQSLSSS